MTRRLVYALVAFVLCAAAAHTLPRWVDVAPRAVESVHNPGAYDGFQFYAGGKFQGAFRLELGFDDFANTGFLRMDSKLIKSDYAVDGDGRLTSGVISVMEKGLGSYFGHDRRTIYTNGKNIVLTYGLGDRDIKTVSVAWSENTIDVDALSLLLPTFLKMSPQSFNADIVVKSKAWKINVDFTYLPPGSWNYSLLNMKLPAGFRDELLAHDEGLHVFQMRLTGLAGLVYGDSFYYIFLNDAQRRFLGYVGGSGVDAEGMILRLEKGVF